MNYYIDLFISKYIKSNKKDRLIYEINSKKKKAEFINHFCHDTKKYVEENKVIFYGKLNECLKMIKSNNKNNYFVISDNYLDGLMMNFDELKIYLEKEYMAILAISDDLTIIKEETEAESYAYILR